MNRNNPGFTLLEVLLALSIISASLVGLIRAYVMIDRSRVQAAKHVQALYLQELKLHDFLQEEKSFRSTQKGVFAPPFEQFRWEISQENQTQRGFRNVHLTIFWTVYDQIKEISLTTYVRTEDDTKTTE